MARCDKEIAQELRRNQQAIETVLGQVVSRASYKLISRLIAEGADVHERQRFDFFHSRNGTALHVGSYYWNTTGIRALLDGCGREMSLAEMVSVRDGDGRLGALTAFMKASFLRRRFPPVW